MHILYITEGFPPELDARPTRAWDHSREWVKAGHRVSVITKAPNHPYGKLLGGYRNEWHGRETMEGVEVHRIWSFITENTGVLRRLLSAVSFLVHVTYRGLRLDKPDVIIATSPTPFASLAGCFIAKIRHVPWVLEVRDLWPESLTAFRVMKENSITRAIRLLSHFLYRASDHITCVSEGQVGHIHRHYGIAKEKMSIMPNGVDRSLFKPSADRDTLRRTLGWSDKFVLLFLGNQGVTYDLEMIVKMAERMGAQKEIHFILVGEGVRKSAIEAMARQKNLTNMLFMPSQEKSRVVELYQAADMLILPFKAEALFEHSRPVKLYEAMASGLPVLASVKGESARMILESSAGSVVLPEDADAMERTLREMYETPEALSRYRGKAVAYIAEHYGRDKIAKDYATLFSGLCAKTEIRGKQFLFLLAPMIFF